jgi:hypothetical protein
MAIQGTNSFVPKAVLVAGRVAHQPFEVPEEMTKSALLQGGVTHAFVGSANKAMSDAFTALEPRGPAKLIGKLFGKIDSSVVGSAAQAQKATDIFWVPFSNGAHQVGHAVSNPFSLFYAKRAGFEIPTDAAEAQKLLAGITDPVEGSTKFTWFKNFPAPAPKEEPAPDPGKTGDGTGGDAKTGDGTGGDAKTGDGTGGDAKTGDGTGGDAKTGDGSGGDQTKTGDGSGGDATKTDAGDGSGGDVKTTDAGGGDVQATDAGGGDVVATDAASSDAGTTATTDTAGTTDAATTPSDTPVDPAATTPSDTPVDPAANPNGGVASDAVGSKVPDGARAISPEVTSDAAESAQQVIDPAAFDQAAPTGATAGAAAGAEVTAGATA